MTETTAPKPLTKLNILRGLRISMWEGAFATVWTVLTQGPFQIGFARQLGASDFHLGLLAALPAAVGLLQLPASLWADRLGSRRRFIGVSAALGRLLWLPIALLPFFVSGALRLPAFLGLLLLSSALLTVTVPAWTSWMSDLVPAEMRGRYFARRNTLAGIVAMLVPLPAGWALDLAVKHHRYAPRLGFALLFGIACLAALVSLFLLLRQPEPPRAARSAGENPLKTLGAPLADPNFRRFLAFSAAVVAGQSLAGQFFVAWQLDSGGLNLPYLAVQLLGAVASGAGLASMPLWGWLSDKYGGRPVLMIGAWGTLSAPLIWLFTDPSHALWTNAALIVLLNLLSGASWAAVGLTQFNLLLRLAPDEKRGTYVAVLSAATGLVGFVAPILGGALMTALAPVRLSLGSLTLNNFKCMFALTDLVRLGALLLLRGVKDEGSVATRHVLGRLVSSGPALTISPLRKLTGGGDQRSRRDAAQKLGAVGSPLAVEELIAALDDVSPDVRHAAARALGDIGDPRAVPALAAKLSDLSAGIGEQAAHSLGFIGDRAATAPLIAAVSGPDASVRLAALRALARLADPESALALVAQLTTAHPSRCEVACAALAALGENLPESARRETRERLTFLLAQEVDRGMRLAAARALEALAPVLSEAFDAVADRLTREFEPAVVAIGAGALARLDRDRAPGPILALLPRLSDDRLARRQALTALADCVLEPGAFYPYLSLGPLERDAAASRRLKEAGKRRHREAEFAGVLERFAAGDTPGTLAAIRALAPDDEILAALARHASSHPEAALLAVLRLTG